MSINSLLFHTIGIHRDQLKKTEYKESNIFGIYLIDI